MPPSSDPRAASGSGHTRMRRRRLPLGALSLRAAWRNNAPNWIAWSRAPNHDSYWRFHRDQFLTLLPAPGLLTVDIGAGEGRLTRDLVHRGHRVVAIDASHTLALAARDADAATRIAVADAAALPLRAGIADLAVAFMVLQDVDDLHGAVREAARVLMPGGRLCLAIVHPLNSAGQFEDDAEGRFIIAGAYLERRIQIDQLERDGLTVELVSVHRPLQDYVAACADAGLLVERLREPAVPDEALRSRRDRRWQRLPLFLHMRAVRTRDGAADPTSGQPRRPQ